MRQTLFYIPHELFGLPVFGLGWLFGVWSLACLLFLVWLIWRQGWNAETRSYLPIMLIVAVAIWFVLPLIEESPEAGPPLGLPIRGYGVMLLLGVVSGVGLAVQQARRVGLDPEIIFSLAFYMFIGGIVGARLFFVIQEWDNQFAGGTPREIVWRVLNVTQGGLVVYGSLIGAATTGIYFLRKNRLPVLAIADLIAPSLMLGLAIGRVGCLLNGCCHGGLCEIESVAVTFPAESPPYQHQRSLGQLHGFSISQLPDSDVVIAAVFPESPAEAAGLTVGQEVRAINGHAVDSLPTARQILRYAAPEIVVTTDSGQVRVQMDRYPERSRPTHPTQIYSSINAALMCLLLWAFYPFRRRDGQVIALLLTLYPVQRFLLELIRNDEPGRFGTGLTISQLVSLGVVLIGIGLWFHSASRSRGSAYPVSS